MSRSIQNDFLCEWNAVVFCLFCEKISLVIP